MEGSEQLGDGCSGTGRPGCVDRLVVDVATDFLGDGRGDLSGTVEVEIHCPASAVSVEPVADMEVLLEVVPQREVEEWPPVGGEFHGGR